MASPNLDDVQHRMDQTLQVLKKELAGLRTGRASASLLEPVVVSAYGSDMPLNQVGTVSVPEPRMISVQVWDQTVVKAVDRAIREAGLGLNPMIDGNHVRVPIPDLTAERRQELAKVAGKYAEEARIAVRNVRRDGMDMLKRMEKDGEISEDELHGWSDKVQKLTDEHVAAIDKALASKTEEIRQV